MLKLYGIGNCDTVKKARRWLDSNGVAYLFHDFRKDGIEPMLLDHWLKQVDWVKMLNRRGTTWRKLPNAQREDINAKRARQLMLENPTLIKRPVSDDGQIIDVGFDNTIWQQRFGN